MYHLFVVTVADRESFREAMNRDGVETLVHYPRPIHLQPAYERLAPPGDRLRECERLSAQVVSLPLFPELEEREIEAVINAARRAAPS